MQCVYCCLRVTVGGLLCVWSVCTVSVTVCAIVRITACCVTYLSNSSVHTSSKLRTIFAICSVSCSAVQCSVV
jgi:hypothetical protein